MSADPQREVQDFLSDPATHGGTPVERIDTHAAMVFLAGERAFKVKRQVRFSFLDFSSLELRRAALESELSLNRRTAPEIYLRVRRITRGVSGGLEWDSAGEIVEWVLEMRRFDQALRLDRLADAGKLTGAMIADLVDALIDLHARAEVLGAPYGGAEDLEGIVRDNTADLGEWPELFPPSEVTSLDEDCWAAWRALAPLLDRRRARGWVRHGHGDLHLANVVLWKGRPTPFDCIEFNPELRWIDTISEAAFVAMDLQARGYPGYGWRFINRYLEDSVDYEAIRLLRYYVIYRALVRAKVEALQVDAAQKPSAQAFSTAFAYLNLADSWATRRRVGIIIMHGLSGSGKSTVATQLVEALGAIRLRSDVVRKQLFNLRPDADSGSATDQGIYSAESTEKTYRRLQQLTEMITAAHFCVIVDATFLDEARRRQFLQLQTGLRCARIIVNCEAPEATLRKRILERKNDPSEANLDVLERQIRTRQAISAEEREMAGVVNVGPDSLSAAQVDEIEKLLAIGQQAYP